MLNEPDVIETLPLTVSVPPDKFNVPPFTNRVELLALAMLTVSVLLLTVSEPDVTVNALTDALPDNVRAAAFATM
jgi:hypothetical protein